MFLQITDEGSGRELFYMSGHNNGSIVSDTNNVLLYFTSDYSVTKTGFLIEYSQIDEGKFVQER